MSELVFLDTEANARHAQRRPWEIAMIRRDGRGGEQEITIFIDIADIDLDNAEPESLRISGFHRRHPHFGYTLTAGQYHCRERDAAAMVYDWTAGAAVYGINPDFDVTCLEPMMGRHALTPVWFYAPQDVAMLASEHLLGLGQMPARDVEALSVQCGVPVPQADRHTALGDARWAASWFDELSSSRAVVGQ